MARSLVALVSVAALACGGTSTAPTPPSSTAPSDSPAVTEEPPPPGPEVIERVVDDRDKYPEDGCTAQRPESGIIDPTSPKVARLEIIVGAQNIVENVEMRSGLSIELAVGGCAHYGNYFSVLLDAEKPMTDVEHYLYKSLSVFDALPYRAGADTALGEIRDLITKSRADPKAMADCYFPDGQGYASAGCKLETVGVKVRVSVWRDIAL